MSLDFGKRYTLTLNVRGRKTKGQISRECTIEMKACKQFKIQPGDRLTVEVVEHHHPEKTEEPLEAETN